MDYFNNFSNDWIGYIKTKIRGTVLNIFLNKKILIYGLGKSGIAAFKFLKNKSDIFLYDDYQSKIKSLELKKNFINYKNIFNLKFDKIILSPGIDINKCKLSKFLKKNYTKIHSDLDVFYSFFKNDCITITGTNGKSTTCQLLYEILLSQKFDVKLVGNIGNPILSIKNVKRKTIFVIEASSYQLDYSKIFKSKYAAVLNLSPDHIERHHTLSRYIKAKFKLLKHQSKGNLAFVKKNDFLIKNYLKSNRFKSKIIKINTQKKDKFLRNIDNNYFSTETNKENLLFVLEISKKLKIKKNLLIKTIQKFRGLNYRQQILIKRKNLIIINDSKSTSFSSSIGLLKSNKNIYWLLGGVPKKGDKFNLSKIMCKNHKAFIFGAHRKQYSKILKNKLTVKSFKNLPEAIEAVFSEINSQTFKKNIIFFSPAGASFDSFKNFEDRGNYFNKLIKKYTNAK